MGRLPPHDRLGGPQGWEALFNDPQHHGMPVNLAHFGGEHDVSSRGNKGWTERFVELMGRPGTENLYADLGHWIKLVEGDSGAIDRLAGLLDRPIYHGQTVADRLMFGSDWLMISRFGNWEQYALKFQPALNKASVPVETQEKLFYRNAQRLYGQSTAECRQNL